MDPRESALLHEQFEDQARQTPDSVALWYRDTPVTFAALDARASQVAGHLRDARIGTGAYVGLHVERSADYVAALLGILKAGCAVVPLPPSYPAARLREILSYAALDAVIDDLDTPLDPAWTRRILHLSDLLRAEPAVSVSDPARTENYDRPAFVLCSSGSTGTPKMIERSHGSFFHRLRWTWQQHPYRAGEVCVQKSHMTTTHAIYELFEPLLRGVPQHIIADGEVRDLETFWETIQARAVTRLLIVPSMLQASLEMPGFAAPALDVLILMGEHVPHRLAGQALEAFGARTRIFSIYGSTEASSTLVCDVRASYQPGQELPLGQPISPDVQAVVLDESHNTVQRGGSGMLYIAGPALFSAYFKAPDRTAETFLSREGSSRLYRTQDQVRVLPDGQLQFVGRVDDTVKIRGFRVDLKEVERAIRQNSAVRQCTVLVEGSDRDSALVAFVTPATVAASAVLQTVRATLPGYMVPGVVVALDAFPLTASGKVDRRRLLDEFARPQQAADNSQFTTPTERSVADVWRQVLGHSTFAADSSFFEVGGTSLSVFAAVHQLRNVFGLTRAQLADLSIYQHATLAALAAHIDAVRAGRASPVTGDDPALVTLKRGSQPELPPMFMISSAGGTLGAYEKLVKAMGPKRDVIGVRDPFIWGDRDPTQGFQAWIGRYLEAIRKRQPAGPYYITAYSSAGAFGYEIARQLRAAGQEVALLTLIDPLALDRASKARFGWWALDARFRRPPMPTLIRSAGQLRGLLPTRSADAGISDWKISEEQFRELAASACNNAGYIRMLSALLELNSGLPFALTEEELKSAGDGGAVAALLAKVRSVAPETDLETIEKIVVQYELQVRAQHNYQLQKYDGPVVLFEPEGRYRGLEAAQLKPYAPRLRSVGIPVGASSDRVRQLTEFLPNSIRTHYLCMRDDAFTSALAAQVDALTL